jgi:predicted enzyme related to lactoylglutathione lyase
MARTAAACAILAWMFGHEPWPLGLGAAVVDGLAPLGDERLDGIDAVIGGGAEAIADAVVELVERAQRAGREQGRPPRAGRLLRFLQRRWRRAIDLERLDRRTRGLGMFDRVAPIFPVNDVAAALEFHARLGFDVRTYVGDDYGFASRDGVEIHLGRVADSGRHPAAAYLHVLDVDAVAVEWRAAGGEVHGPQDTPWGRHEGALVDPDGANLRPKQGPCGRLCSMPLAVSRPELLVAQGG